MMYRLAEIASYPGNPPTCTPIIAIKFPSNFLVGFPAFSSKAVLQNSGSGSGRSFVPVPGPASARRAHWSELQLLTVSSWNC